MFNLLHPRRLWRDSSRKSKIIASALTLVLVPTTAWAVVTFLFHLGLGGSLQSGGFTYTYSAPSVSSTGVNAGDICGGVSLSPDSKTLSITPGTGAFPGDVCNIKATIVPDSKNTTTGEVDGLTFPDLPTGWSAALTLGCASTISTTSTGVSVNLQITDNSGATNGSSVSLSGDSIDVAPASQVPATPTPTCSVTK